MNLIERDKKVIWHPYTQVKGALENIPIVRGEGAYLIAEDGTRYLDGISSWWVNVHGHSNKYIAEKVSEQLITLEHSIFAGFTHPKAVELAERLLDKLPTNQQKTFYSDNGSTAVEVALKMAFQYWSNKSELRNKIIVLEGSYHGDTFGAMSVSARGAFNNAFQSFLFDVETIPFPTGDGKNTLDVLSTLLNDNQIAAIIVEPLVQGAAGMRMYEPTLLDSIFKKTKEAGIIVIADEVMTGFGRTGKMFAVNHINTQPDIICLSKGITGGTMALGVTTATDEIFNAFISDDKMKTFFHGHSYTANPIACAASCASMDLFDMPELWQKIEDIASRFVLFKNEINTMPSVKQVQTIGAIIAIEIKTDSGTSYFNNKRNVIYNHFLSRNILLRPLGNVLYFMPPYCIEERDVELVLTEILKFLMQSSTS